MAKRFVFLAVFLMFSLITPICCLAETATETLPTLQTPGSSIASAPVMYADVNGVQLGYREFGSGEPLLMLMGFGCTMDDWDDSFIGILASKYHVYIYDHRGMGYSSDDPAVSPSISLYASDAATLMSALGYDSMHVYGVSMGSSVSQQLAVDYPEQVRRLVLSSSTYSIRINETQALLDEIEATATDPDVTEGIRREAEANLAWNGTFDDLAGIENDVMLMVGTADDLTPDSVSVTMAGQINGSWLFRFKDIPHAGSMYIPEEYGRCVLTFLGLLESESS